MTDPPPRLSKAHAICVYAEPLAVGRRVLVVGDASLDLGARLVDAGARIVHIYDPDNARAAAARPTRGVTVRALPAGEIDVRDGAFDLVLVPEISEVGDPASLLGRLRRIVGGEGAVLVAARNPEAYGAGMASAVSPALRAGAPSAAATAVHGRGIEYTELYDLVALQFANVRMIAQVPFRGVTLAELDETADGPEVSVDTQLVTEAGVPETFLALGSQTDVRLGAYTIVQLPAEDAPTSPEATANAAADALANAALRTSLIEVQHHADLLGAQLEEERALSKRAAAEGDRARKADDSVQARLKESEARAGDHYVRAERLTHDMRKLGEELERQRDRATRLTKELEDEKRSRARSDVDLGAARNNPELGLSRNRVAMLEQSLRAAEESAATHEARLHDAERAIALRDQQLAILAAEFDAVRTALDAPQIEPEVVQRLAERANRAEANLAMAEMELTALGDTNADELVTLELQLQERAGVIQALEAEIARRERLVRELVSAVEELHLAPAETALNGHSVPDEQATLTAGENVELRAKLDKLALHVARREADLQSQAWTIAELEQRGPGGSGSGANGVAEKELSVARTELDALRQALAQEHAALTRVESGDELAKARAELARQAVLIEQLSRELEAKDRSRSAPAQG